ncbi:hypothetical protein [Pseudoalteromonas sp.]
MSFMRVLIIIFWFRHSRSVFLN